MSGLFGSTPSPPPPVQPVPSPGDPAVQAAARQQAVAAANAAGRGSTLLTGGAGDTSSPVVGKSVLLGG